LLNLVPKHEILKDREIQEIRKLTENYGEEVVKSNIKYTNRQKYQNYYVYLKKAIMEDYAEKDRKIEEMKASERKKYEQQVKQEEAEAKAREEMMTKAKKYYQVLDELEKAEVEAQAVNELELLEGIDFVKKKPMIYENMKMNKIAEIVQEKYLC